MMGTRPPGSGGTGLPQWLTAERRPPTLDTQPPPRFRRPSIGRREVLVGATIHTHRQAAACRPHTHAASLQPPATQCPRGAFPDLRHPPLRRPRSRRPIPTPCIAGGRGGRAEARRQNMHAPQAAGTPSLDSVLPLVVLSIAGVSLYIPQPFNPAPSPSGLSLIHI